MSLAMSRKSSTESRLNIALHRKNSSKLSDGVLEDIADTVYLAQSTLDEMTSLWKDPDIKTVDHKSKIVLEMIEVFLELQRVTKSPTNPRHTSHLEKARRIEAAFTDKVRSMLLDMIDANDVLKRDVESALERSSHCASKALSTGQCLLQSLRRISKEFVPVVELCELWQDEEPSVLVLASNQYDECNNICELANEKLCEE